MKVLSAEHAAVNPEHAGKFLGQGAVVILGTEPPHQPHAESRLKMTALAAAAHVGEGAGAVLIDDAFEFAGDLVNGLIPGDTLETVSHPF